MAIGRARGSVGLKHCSWLHPTDPLGVSPPGVRDGDAMIDAQALRRFAPKVQDAHSLAREFESARRRSSVNSIKRLAHFMGQVYVETGGFALLQENLNYRTPEQLVKIFSAVKGIEDAKALIAQGPVAIANRVYAQRIGNGDEQSGDGWRYRGSGYIQLTGRANYQAIGELIGMDLVTNPDLVRAPSSAARVAFAFWDAKQLSPLADVSDVEEITFRVNGKAKLHLAERAAATARAMFVWSVRAGEVHRRAATRF